jgi:hypothetical protein
VGRVALGRFTDVLGIIEHALATGEISSEDSRFYDFATMPMSTKPLQDSIPFGYPGSPLTAGGGATHALKIASGRNALTMYWPASTISEIFRSTARLHSR